MKVGRINQLTANSIDSLSIDSLYNPQYGYFPKQVVIFNPEEPFDFNSIPNESTFHRLLGQKYTDFEDALDEQQPNKSRQLWHTPTELFQPYYGEAIAQYLVRNYQIKYFPHRDLIIYEMGAGNGTLMHNILDYIKDFHPEIYDRTKYKIIEISPNLAALQASQLTNLAASQGHVEHVEIVNQSIFDWDHFVSDPCYFLALEVFDNFAHDCIRYDPLTEEPLQGQVLIDNDGEFYEFYTKEIDKHTSRFLQIRNAACSRPFPHPLRGPPLLRNLRYQLPFAPNLTLPEYVPTRLMQFFEILNDHFPLHHLLTSDFHTLPDAIAGFNAPIVQTRYQRRVVPVTTPLVQQGFFDILFPTNFSVMEAIYCAITGRQAKISTHEEFLQQWAYVEDTRTRNGENPLLSWYKNASVMTTK